MSKGLKILLVSVGIAIALVAVLIGNGFDFASAFSPPPASRVFLLGDKPSVSKDLCSSAAQMRLGSVCHPASSFTSDSFPVNRGEDLTIKIKYLPPASIGESEQYPHLARVIERLPGGGYFSYQGAEVYMGGNIVSFVDPISVGTLISGDLAIEYRFANTLRPEEALELTITLRAEKYTTSGSITIDQNRSIVRYEDSNGRSDIPLDQAQVMIADIIGPKGDIYSHGSIDNRSQVLGTDLNQIDVIGAGRSIDGFGNQPDWQVPGYNLEVKDEKFFDTDYYKYYRAKIGRRMNLIIKEANVQIGNDVNINSQAKPFGYYSGNLVVDNREINFNGSKTIIVNRNANITNSNILSDKNGVAIVSLNGDININNTTDQLKLVNLHLLALNGRVNVNNSGSGHLIIKGSISAKAIKVIGNNQVSYIYDSSGIGNIPGVSEVYDFQPLIGY